eukprot:jgi/Hompol1/5831/HPOL_002381-RA
MPTAFDPLSLRTLRANDDEDDNAQGADSVSALGFEAEDSSDDEQTSAPSKKSASSHAAASSAKRKAKDLNPGFSFTLADSLPVNPNGAAWDFASSRQALAARASQKASAKTSIDDKIRRTMDGLAGDIAATAASLRTADEAEDDINDDEAQAGAAEDDDDEDQDDDRDKDNKPSARNGPEADDDDDDNEEAEHIDLDVDDQEDIVRDKRNAAFFAEDEAALTARAPETTESFHSLQISRPVLRSIAALGYVRPTSIQARAIPLAMQGRDICGSAVTGSGKTAAFVIPIVERLLFKPKNQATTRVLILVPTRELGVQCQSVATSLSQFTDISICLCVGGLSTKLQEAELQKRPDIVIATPGRLIDHIHNSRSFSLDTVEILVIDEADRILEDGFAAELDEIIKHTPKTRQTMLFSATMTDNVDDLIKLSLTRPVRLFVDRSTTITNKLIQEFIRVRDHREETRPAILAALCARTYTAETIIFFRSKAAAHHMKIVFGFLGLKAAELHGNLTQLQRLEAIDNFTQKKVDYLLATDLASRGLDIPGVKTVINYDMPKTYNIYVHRVGRTARGERGGRAVSLVGEADRQILKLAIKNTKDAVKHRIVPGDVIQKYQSAIGQFSDAIKQIYAQEKEEKELGTAEMEVTRAQNLLDHRDEIISRPARTWFQSEKERANSKEEVAKSSTAKGAKPSDSAAGNKRAHGTSDGLSRKKRRMREAKEHDRKEQANQMRAARSAKASKKPQRIKQMRDAKPTGKSRKPKGNRNRK